MHKPTPILLALCALVSTLAGCPFASAQGDDATSLTPNAVLGVVGASLARAEEALGRSLVSSSQVKGVFGEEVMERIVLKGSRDAKWHAVSLSPKPQGIDGIYLKRNRSGQPTGLLVAEAKFRTAKLGKTKDGIQLGAKWTLSRLGQEASRYRQASQGRTVQLATRPKGLAANPDVVKAQLPDGRAGYLWRNTKSSPWFYDGPSGTLETAQSAVGRDGRYLQGAADRTISFRQRLYNIDVTRDTISVDVRRARTTGNGGVKLTHLRVFKIDAIGRAGYLAGVREEYARQLLSKLPHLAEREARAIASAATRNMRHLEAVLTQGNRPMWQSALHSTGRVMGVGAGLGGVFDAAGQLYSGRTFDWAQFGGMTLLSAGVAGAGAMTNQFIVSAAIQNLSAYRVFAQAATALGLPTANSAIGLFGKAMGGVVGSCAFAGALFLTGNMEGGDASRLAVASAIGSVGGVAASGAIIGLATMYGTASTGVAISTLSGAAASNAALASLGGGSIAAGGGGMALGGIIATGGLVIAALAVTGAVYVIYEEYDDREANARYQMSAANLAGNLTVMKEVCRRTWFAHLGAE